MDKARVDVFASRKAIFELAVQEKREHGTNSFHIAPDVGLANFDRSADRRSSNFFCLLHVGGLFMY